MLPINTNQGNTPKPINPGLKNPGLKAPSKGNSLRDTLKAQHPEWTDDQLSAAMAVAGPNLPKGALNAAATVQTQSLAARFSKSKAVTSKAKREAFDPISHYGLHEVQTIGTREGKNGEPVPIQCGIVYHAPGTMRTDRFGKQSDASRYNGNIAIIGLKGTVEVLTAETAALVADIAPALARYLTVQSANILQAMGAGQ